MFLKIFDENNNFKDEFNKRKAWGKSYYNLFWDKSEMIICLRHNVNQNIIAVELYIEECTEEIYAKIVSQIQRINEDYGEELKFKHTRAVKNNDKGKAAKIYITKQVEDLSDKNNWNENIEWMVKNSLKFKQIYNKYFRKNDSWIIVCNPKMYDVDGALKKLDKIEWKQSINVRCGDIVYIYIGSPIQAICYKCKVTNTNITNPKRDDNEFILDGSNYVNYKRYMELELEVEYRKDEFILKKLKEHGLKSVQGPSKVKEELKQYLELVNVSGEKAYFEDEEIADQGDFHVLENLEKEIAQKKPEYSKERIVRTSPTIHKGRKVYPRNKEISINALVIAEYKCEINNEHWSFKKRNGLVYMESHHLIPMAYQDKFKVSLDREQNIICLCSTCHNRMHYGQDADELLEKLYNERKELLKEIGIEITLNELLEMYR